ncbi:MAG: hypothetical protein NTX03_10105 [Bacteroidetes bacterium]|nr:hypothetical protein [Bacteroidota bacterium]
MTNIIDLSTLRNLTNDDPSMMKELVEIMLTYTPTQLDDILKLINEKNTEDLANSVYKIRSNIENWVSGETKSLANDIEVRLRGGATMDDVLPKVITLEKKCREAIIELQRQYGDVTGASTY